METWNLRLEAWNRLYGRYLKPVVVFLVAAVLVSLVQMLLREGRLTVPPKTSWDWFDLFSIPVALGVGAWLFSKAKGKADRRAALDGQHEAVLVTYMDRMSELMLNHDLFGYITEVEMKGEADVGNEAYTVAVARTVYVLRNLDEPRIAQVVRFLTAANLGGRKLLEHNLEGVNLQGVNWEEVNLEGANLIEADLREANLIEADLRWVLLMGANLRGVLLMGANLRGAYMNMVDLRGADLNDADLQEADLKGAKVTPKQLAACGSLENATMPDGQRYQDWVARGKPDWTKRK